MFGRRRPQPDFEVIPCTNAPKSLEIVSDRLRSIAPIEAWKLLLAGSWLPAISEYESRRKGVEDDWNQRRLIITEVSRCEIETITPPGFQQRPPSRWIRCNDGAELALKLWLPNDNRSRPIEIAIRNQKDALKVSFVHEPCIRPPEFPFSMASTWDHLTTRAIEYALPAFSARMLERGELLESVIERFANGRVLPTEIFSVSDIKSVQGKERLVGHYGTPNGGSIGLIAYRLQTKWEKRVTNEYEAYAARDEHESKAFRGLASLWGVASPIIYFGSQAHDAKAEFPPDVAKLVWEALESRSPRSLRWGDGFRFPRLW